MEGYLKEHHSDDIVAILRSPKKTRNYEIKLDLTLLKEKFPNLYEKLVNDYKNSAVKWTNTIRNVQKIAKEAIEKDQVDNNEGAKDPEVKNEKDPEDPPKLIVKPNILIKLVNHPNIEENFKLLPEKHFLKVIAFKAVIVKKHQPKNRIMTKQFMCSRCKKPEIENADRYFGYGFIPGRCQNAITFETGGTGEDLQETCQGKMVPVKYTPKKSQKLLQTQVYEVTVPHLEQHKVYGDKTYHMDVEGKFIGAFDVGQAVDIIGVVKTRNTSRKAKMTKFGILALNIEPKEQKVDPTVDREQNTHYRVLQAWHFNLEKAESELRARNQIIESLFPEIVGAFAVKLGILLVTCSGSGKESDTSKESEKRDVFHMMLAGQHTAGKGTLLRAAAQLTPKANEVHSFAITLSALTARSFKIKQGGDNNLEAGVLLRANDGVSCFHDFHGLKKKYRMVLHEIMESQRVKVASARLKVNIKVSASIIAAHRIKSVRHKTKNQSDEINTKMFKVEESLLSRFDLIFVMNEPKRDANYKQKVIDMVLEEAMGIEREEDENWPHERILAHIALAKTFGSIEFTPEADAILRKYYLFCTLHPDIPKWRSSNRMYEGLRRMTAAHARLMLRKKAKIFDAISTVLLCELSFPLGYLMETRLQLNDDLPGPDDETVQKVLWLLKMPDNFNDVYVEEQSNFSEIEAQITNWVVKKVESETSLDESIVQSQMDTTVIPSKNTKKAAPKKKQKGSAKKSSSNKRNLSSIENISEPAKKPRIDEPANNEAIFENLALLAAMFGGEEKKNDENVVQGKSQEELKEMENFFKNI